jgi:RND family efflux transporter MFP subunit
MSETDSNAPENQGKPYPTPKPHPLWVRIIGILVTILLAAAIVTAGALIASNMIKNKPKSKRQRPPHQDRLVEVIPVERRDVPVTIEARGTVIPAREIELKSQVAGKIISMNPKIIPGGWFEEGQDLIRIEPDDYQLIVQQRQSDITNAESYLKLEHGNQAIAKQEFNLLGEEIAASDRELVLRQPQLVSAQAALEAAQARLDQAKLDLQRTNITAPFNAVVKEKYVDLGAMVSQATTLVSLTGTDEYWVEVMVPEKDLKWIQIPGRNGGEGSKVKIYNPSGWDKGVYREGRVFKLRSELEEMGRRARLLISIRDPLAVTVENVGKQPLLIDSYILAEIEGQTVSSVVRLDRDVLRDGDNVWILTPEGTLAIRPMEVVFRGEDTVLIRDSIEPGDQIVTTDLATPVEGMKLRTQDETQDTNSPDDRGQEPGTPPQRGGKSE